MNSKVLNLSFMVFWLILGAGLLTRHLWMPAEMNERVSGANTPLVIAVSGLFAVWNFMRFWVAHQFQAKARASLSPQAEEYRRRIRAELGDDPRVTDPQFNFDDPPTEANR